MTHPLAFRMLVAIAGTARQPDVLILYAPATWLREQPTPRRRGGWSRTLRRLAVAGLIRHQTDDSRDRVRRVSIAPSGWNWILENCGAGAFLSLEDLLNVQGQWPGEFVDQALRTSRLSEEFLRYSLRECRLLRTEKIPSIPDNRTKVCR